MLFLSFLFELSVCLAQRVSGELERTVQENLDVASDVAELIHTITPLLGCSMMIAKAAFHLQSLRHYYVKPLLENRATQCLASLGRIANAVLDGLRFLASRDLRSWKQRNNHVHHSRG